MRGIFVQETLSRNVEIDYRESEPNKRVIYLGNLALQKSDILGINDPMTHLLQYLERGDEALVGIKEDIETDVAERLPETPFVNYVDFEYRDGDFVSSKDEVSMDSMAKNNLRIISAEYSKNSSFSQEYERAQVEALEVEKLSEWFDRASVGSYSIFESLPIGDQKIAVSRIYKKTSANGLEGCFVSLYNPTVEKFNTFRSMIKPGIDSCASELAILDNNYELDQSEVPGGNLVDYYVGKYDETLNDETDDEHSFGIKINNIAEQKEEGLSKVRRQTKLTSIYLNAIELVLSLIHI